MWDSARNSAQTMSQELIDQMKSTGITFSTPNYTMQNNDAVRLNTDE